MRYLILAALTLQLSGEGAQGIIICDYDHRLAPLKGSIEMKDHHLICDLHVIFDKKGRVICPIDGSKGRR